MSSLSTSYHLPNSYIGQMKQLIKRLYNIILTTILLLAILLVAFAVYQIHMTSVIRELDKNYTDMLNQYVAEIEKTNDLTNRSNQQQSLQANQLNNVLRTIDAVDNLNVNQVVMKLNYNNVGSFDLLTPSGLSSAKLDLLLTKTGFAGYGEVFYEAEMISGVNAVFLIALAGLESGWNSSDIASSKNNVFGWCAYDDNLEAATAFESVSACILDVASKIRSLYLNEDGIYYRGRTLYDVNINYCGSDSWPLAVGDIMCSLYNKTKTVQIQEEL